MSKCTVRWQSSACTLCDQWSQFNMLHLDPSQGMSLPVRRTSTLSHLLHINLDLCGRLLVHTATWTAVRVCVHIYCRVNCSALGSHLSHHALF